MRKIEFDYCVLACMCTFQFHTEHMFFGHFISLAKNFSHLNFHGTLSMNDISGRSEYTSILIEVSFFLIQSYLLRRRSRPIITKTFIVSGIMYESVLF